MKQDWLALVACLPPPPHYPIPEKSMPPNGRNAKKESGRAKKAENARKKQEAATLAKEKKEAEQWAIGAKSNKAAEDKAAKKAAEAARKAENVRLLAEEEAALSKPKQTPKAGKGKAKPPPPKPAGPSSVATDEGFASVGAPEQRKGEEEPVESFVATGIDDTLEFLEIVNAKTDKATIGQQAASIERHPERRLKAAHEAYMARELPRVKAEVNTYSSLIIDSNVFFSAPVFGSTNTRTYSLRSFRNRQTTPTIVLWWPTTRPRKNAQKHCQGVSRN
ncbi:hypothetical protein FRC08_002460 [Ceratobasidium sp. 394]|nr:hypothetical protein FRC08_002460 [Ceratobasidium sp. 394]